MSHPRQVVPLATYLISRRILRRHFLLRPDAAITGIILYTLAVSSRLFGVEVHAVCAMSTHLHLVVTDVQGVLPASCSTSTASSRSPRRCSALGKARSGSPEP